MNDAISRKRERIYLSLVLVLGAVLRVVRLGHQSFWYDEVYSANLSAKSLGVVVPRFGQTPTFYHILLHFWLYLGRSDAFIRLLSALFGVAALWVIYLLGKHLLDAKHGLLCALLLAISPFHIWYSQEARMYTLLILLSMASVLFFLKLLQEPRGRAVVWWALTTGLAIYTHYYAVFIPFFQLIFFLFFWQRYRSRRRSFCYALGAIIILVMPIFFLLLSGGRYAALFAVGAGANPVHIFSVPYSFFTFSLGFSYGSSVADLHRSLSIATVRPYLAQILPAALVYSALFVLGLLSLWRERERLIIVLLYLIVPFAGGCLVSLLWPQISYNVRYVSTVLPAYVLILARGLLAPQHKTFRWALLAPVLILTTISIHNLYYEDKYAKEDYRSAVQLISARSADGDVILTTHKNQFHYYYEGSRVVHKLIWSPTFHRQMIKARVRGFHRMWLVLSREWQSDPEGLMREYIQKTFPAIEETTFSNIYLGLFDVTKSQVISKRQILWRTDQR